MTAFGEWHTDDCVGQYCGICDCGGTGRQNMDFQQRRYSELIGYYWQLATPSPPSNKDE